MTNNKQLQSNNNNNRITPPPPPPPQHRHSISETNLALLLRSPPPPPTGSVSNNYTDANCDKRPPLNEGSRDSSHLAPPPPPPPPPPHGRSSVPATSAPPPHYLNQQQHCNNNNYVISTLTSSSPHTSSNFRPLDAHAAAAASTTSTPIAQVRQRLEQAGHSLRQLYASASSIAGPAVAQAVEVAGTLPPSYHNIPGIVPYYHGRSVGPPPSYDDVINPYAPPPTYQSLFGQMREARKSSRGLVDLARRLLIILLSTLGCTILVAFIVLIPFTMIIVGAVYLDDCNIEHIPAFLLVGGLVWASKNLLHCYSQCRKVHHQEQNEALAAELYLAQVNNNNNNNSSSTSSTTSSSSSTSREEANAATTEAPSIGPPTNHQRGRRLKSSICESLLNCILFGWFIAGCVIVFRNYEPDFDNHSSSRYCHRTVYMYTFWLVTSALLSFGLFIGCICCLMVSSALASRQHDIDLA